MIAAVRRLAARAARVVCLVLVATVATTALTRFAPGYFSDSREVDAAHASVAREELQERRGREASIVDLAWLRLNGIAHADLGRSRQFEMPVAQLLRERARASAKLLGVSLLGGWTLALAFALPLSARQTRRGEALIAAPTAVLLSIPAGAMATACLVANLGGPALVLSAILAARDFKILYRLLRYTWGAQHFIYARAQGSSTPRIIAGHLIPALKRELAGLAATSLVLGLSACVPVEVIFDVPGLGQLAWNAAMNRDLPVLVGVTLVMAMCVGIAGTLAGGSLAGDVVPCA